MLTPIVLVIVLMVATCVIAYWSDNLGKKLGKKRITLFNLRPRQTATLIGMASSVGIMLLTLAGLLFVNRSLRHALLHYDEAVRANKLLKQDNDAQSASLKLTQFQTQQANKAKQQAEKDRQKAETDRQVAVQGRATAQQDLAQAKNELDAAQHNLQAAQAGRSAAEAGQRGAEEQARHAEERVRMAQTRYNEAQTRYSQAQGRLAQAQRQVRIAEEEVTKFQTQAHAAQSQARFAQAQTREANAKTADARRITGIAQKETLKARKETVKSIQETVKSIQAKSEADKQVAQAKTELAQLRSDLEKTRTALSTTEDSLRTARQNNVGFQSGLIIATPELVLATATVHAGATRAELESAMQETLRAGGGAAQRLGTAQQPVEGVTLEKISLVDKNDKPTYTLTPDQIIPSLAQLLENSPMPVSLILLPTRFHALGDKQIEVRFIYVEVKKIFEDGEVISRIAVDPNESDAQLYEALQLLSEQGRSIAGSRGMPVQLTARESFYAPGTLQRVFDALHRVQNWGKAHPEAKSVEVRLIADSDLTTDDQMRIRFGVASA